MEKNKGQTHLTKSLPRVKFMEMRDMLGVESIA